MSLKPAIDVFSDLMEAREPLDRFNTKSNAATKLLNEVRGAAAQVGVGAEVVHEHTLVLTFPGNPDGIYINYDKKDGTWAIWAIATKRTIVNLRWSRGHGSWSGVARWTNADGSDQYESAARVLANEVATLLTTK